MPRNFLPRAMVVPAAAEPAGFSPGLFAKRPPPCAAAPTLHRSAFHAAFSPQRLSRAAPVPEVTPSAPECPSRNRHSQRRATFVVLLAVPWFRCPHRRARPPPGPWWRRTRFCCRPRAGGRAFPACSAGSPCAVALRSLHGPIPLLYLLPGGLCCMCIICLLIN